MCIIWGLTQLILVNFIFHFIGEIYSQDMSKINSLWDMWYAEGKKQELTTIDLYMYINSVLYLSQGCAPKI